MANCVLNLLVYSNGHCKSKIIQILEIFHPAINKYSFLLKYEDSFYDLQLFVIKLIKENNWLMLKDHTEGAIINYIYKSLYHEYIRLNKYQKQYNYFFYTHNSQQLDNVLSTEDEYVDLLLSDIKRILTLSELEIVTHHFIAGLSINEIAQKKNLSRQAINRKKIHTITKLKQQLILCY